jgi:hypothetical protein
MIPPPQLPDRTLHVLKDELPPLKSSNTALVAAATTSGLMLAQDSPYTHTIEEVQGREPRQQTIWCLRDMEAEFLPEFEAEKISTSEFIRRFRDTQWRLDNPHHPIAYMAWFHETNQRLRENVKKQKPLLMIRRGGRIAFIPQGSDKITQDKILAML